MAQKLFVYINRKFGGLSIETFGFPLSFEGKKKVGRLGGGEL